MIYSTSYSLMKNSDLYDDVTSVSYALQQDREVQYLLVGVGIIEVETICIFGTQCLTCIHIRACTHCVYLCEDTFMCM